jgi:hypothetical protein
MENSMLTAVATDIRDLSFSADGQEAKFVLVTKYAGDIEVIVPTLCLNLLRVPSGPPPASQNTTIRANSSAKPSTASTHNVLERSTPGNIAVSVPKTWLVAADAQKDLVVVILNHQTDTQLGFALQAKSAEEVAVALRKQASTLAARKKEAAEAKIPRT